MASCTAIEKDHILEAAHQEADEVFPQPPQDNPPGQDIVPFTDPHWERNAPRARVLATLIGGMRRASQKSANYEKLREITQGRDGNPALFYSQLEGAFLKYMNVGPSGPACLAPIRQHFISQLAPDIRCKLQKLQMGPQNNKTQLLDTAFMVYNNQDLKKRRD